MSLAFEHAQTLPSQGEQILTRPPLGGDAVSRSRVSAAISELLGPSKESTKHNWLRAVARLASDLRPDIGPQLVEHLGVEPQAVGSPLGGLSIGELGVVYEALVALTDHTSRRSQGQYFTPDDVAAFMAAQTARFPDGRWLDPCCGVGNLSWHLANAMEDPRTFVADKLTLIDLDPIALKTAAVVLVASFAGRDDVDALPSLVGRSQCRNFLTTKPLPDHDFVIVNPPYGAAPRIDRFRTASSREMYAYFLERIAESAGFIAITPASHLGASKYSELRYILEERPGGDTWVFDNVPDTCFRGFKYGSTNTSKTNFVRAAVTVSAPTDSGWRVSPILRWARRSRQRMWSTAPDYLVPLRKGPAGEWAKVMPGTERVWDFLAQATTRLGDLISPSPTEFSLDVASTPRYYISASKRKLARGSKHTLFFPTEEAMNRGYVLLNSSLPYWWWRCLDGGITLPIRTLLSLPVPPTLQAPIEVVMELEKSEHQNVVVKLNAGRQNENIWRPRRIVEGIDSAILEGIEYDFEHVYSSDMFNRPLGPVTEI